MPGKNLTREEARTRSELLEVESYDVELDLTTHQATFPTTSTVQFTSREPGAETFIDFIGASVESIELNGESLDPSEHWADHRIRLPRLAASNELVVRATGSYMNTGEGLHRMVDPTDQEVYLYTQFEVADCRRMFAVFEQPDLKATYRFTVTAPARWALVSNETTPEPTPADGTWTSPSGEQEPTATWSFPATPRMSCYITALVAGPYDVVRDEAQTRAGTLPLAIYCRRSMTQYLDADEIFDCTKRGFEFFEAEFDQPYPFSKYDQIFTPEYNAGAMENAGCVTLVEDYVFRGKPSEAELDQRANTILHELAHMWFGDLVTMRWWDDLWLNESFAEWASHAAQAEATRWTHAWTSFSSGRKAWGYSQDQLSSTHPIAADMVDLEAVEANFDGITYAKGASVLKQLVAYVGREPFVAGIRTYFAKHAWSNTTLKDLLVELEATSGRDLEAWTRAWLETAGVTTLRPVIETDDEGVITSAFLEQTAPEEHPTLRPHRLAVGLYDLEGEQLVRRESVELDVDGARTDLSALVGKKKGDLLLVNDQDLAYAKIRLDEQSLATAVAHVDGLEDSLARALVLGAAWDMTRDAEMRARDYVALALKSLAREADSTMMRMTLHYASTAASLYVDPARRAELTAELTAGVRRLLEEAEPGSDAQLQLVRAFAGLAESPTDVERLRGIYDGSSPLDGLDIDTDLRWTLLTGLAASGSVDAEAIEAEKQRDATTAGAEKAARAVAARPSPEAKEAAWSAVVDHDELPNETMRQTGRGWRAVHDPQLLAPFVERYHRSVATVWAERTGATAQSVVALMYPMALAGPDLLAATDTWLQQHPGAAPGLRRAVAENRDDVARAVRAQEYDATATD